MKSTTILSLVLLAVGANANIFPTEPVAATIWTIGKAHTVTWREDDAATTPKLAELNNLTINLMNGTDQQQTIVDLIAKGVKGVDLKSPSYTVPKTIVPGQYFVRFNQEATTNFIWSTRFQIVGDGPVATTSAVVNATTPVVTGTPAYGTTTAAAGTTTPAAGTTSSPSSGKPSSSSSSATTNPKAVATTPSDTSTSTPVPQSSGNVMVSLPSSLMSVAMGGAALIFTYLY
jgi:hypothetical protein